MADLSKIKSLANACHVSLDSLSSQLGITPQALSKIIRNNSTKIETLEQIARILNVPVGVFFEDSGLGSTIANGDAAVAGNGINVNNSEAILRALDEIAAQRKLTEEAQRQSAKSQEQIDRLLSIIEKSSNK